MNRSLIDSGMVVLANVFNLLVAAVFFSRAKGLRQVEWYLGIAVLLLALPVALCVIVNSSAKREWWTYILPIFLLTFCLLEFLLDYIIKSDFRSTDFVWIYLAIFYLASLAMIGYSFVVSQACGFLTLVTYFIALIAAWYSHAGVGNG